MVQGLEKKYSKFFAYIKESKIKHNLFASEDKKNEEKENQEKILNNIIKDCKYPMDMLAKIIDKKVKNYTGTTGKNSLIDINKLLFTPNSYSVSTIVM